MDVASLVHAGLFSQSLTKEANVLLSGTVVLSMASGHDGEQSEEEIEAILAELNQSSDP